MSFHCFAIPALHPEPAQSELNAFLAAHRVVTLQRELHLADAANPMWLFCVEVATGAQPPLPGELRVDGGAPRGKGAAVDYRQVFDDADFALYAALRELRKQLAQAEGVPVFAVFSNDQLAAIVRQRVASLADLATVPGVGPARVARHGATVLACLQAQRALQAGGSVAPPAGPVP
jgi:superfamily II DNA helicase RecQ